MFCLHGYLHYICAVLVGARRGRWISGTGVTDGCKPTCGCRKLISGPLPEQQVIFTSELPLRPPELLSVIYFLIHQVSERKPFCVKGAVVGQKGWATLCWVLGSMWEFQLVGNSQHNWGKLGRHSLLPAAEIQFTLTYEVPKVTTEQVHFNSDSPGAKTELGASIQDS